MQTFSYKALQNYERKITKNDERLTTILLFQTRCLTDLLPHSRYP